jgi:hypothetical protein
LLNARIVGAVPPGTTTTNGLGTSSNVLVGVILSGTSVSTASSVSPTVTVSNPKPSICRPVKTWSGPTRSRSVSGVHDEGNLLGTGLFFSHVAAPYVLPTRRWNLPGRF